MLKRISCDKFKIGDKKRPPIEFKEGLNIILGADGAKNSIGKSTLLMIIDFCFGGDDFPKKETSLIQSDKIGHHDICFEFEFNGVSKYFKRSTSYPNRVDVCDSSYKTLKTITNDQFKLGLGKYYDLKNDLSFREWVSPFFRIYNRGNYNETKPINATYRELESSGIVKILKMFDAYQLTNDYEKTLLELKEKDIYYRNSPKYQNLIKIEKKEDLEKVEKELEDLKTKFQKLNEETAKGQADEKANEIEMKSILTSNYRKILREIKKQEALITQINDDESYDENKYSKNYEALLHFFPNANIKSIKELDDFHKKVGSYLKKDAIKSNEICQQIISSLEESKKQIEAELSNFKTVPTVSKSVLDSLNYLRDQIKIHEDSLNNYKNGKKTKEEINDVNKKCEDAIKASTSSVASTINNEIKILNDKIREQYKKEPPILQFNGIKSYSFSTPNDTGTGTRFKALCLLDLALLRKTNLPAFIHDSIIYVNIENETKVDLLKLYEQMTNKQIFIAVADPKDYFVKENGENIAKKNGVITLDEGSNSLYGFQLSIIK